ncbi:kinase-like protein, partial [Panus rudis PR-1116 ss-1]
LGKGSFGEVSARRERSTGNMYAVKLIKHTGMRLGDDSDKVEREIKMLKKHRHEHIIRLREVYHQHDSTFLVMELAPFGSLHNFIQDQQRLSKSQYLYFVTHIRQLILALGLAFIHGKGVIHRDIKPAVHLLAVCPMQWLIDAIQNILMMSRNPPTIAGTPYYMAPEIFKTGKYDCKVDSWGLGTVVFKMLTGQRPFRDDELIVDFAKRIYEDRRNEPHFDVVPPELLRKSAKDFIKRALRIEPGVRMGVDMVPAHRWIHNNRNTENHSEMES